MPRVTEEHVAERKRQILDAARASFAEAGSHGASMDDVCRASGMSKGAVYGYFSSKDDIIAALKLEQTQHDAAAIRTATRQEGTGNALADLMSEAFGALADPETSATQRTGMMLWTEALLSQRVLDAQQLEAELWAGAFELLVQQAQSQGNVTQGVDAATAGAVLAAALYGAAAMKMWQPEIDTTAMGEAILALLGGAPAAATEAA